MTCNKFREKWKQDGGGIDKDELTDEEESEMKRSVEKR